MIQVTRKNRESQENMIKRFTRRVQQSGVLMRVRKKRFNIGKKSKTERRDEALYNDKMHIAIGNLKKMGKFDNEALRELRKRVKQDKQ